MGWLIGTLTRPGQKVVSFLCGGCACGAAALALGRTFHGIDTDRHVITKAAGRLKRVVNALAKAK